MAKFFEGILHTRLLVVFGIVICSWLLPLPASATPALQTAAPPNGNSIGGVGVSSHLYLPLVQTDLDAKISAADCGSCLPQTGVNPIARIIDFGGYAWIINDGATFGGTVQSLGDNFCSPDNVWKDANGDLHLKISSTGQNWTCAEVISTQPVAFGQFQWQILGQLDKLEPQVNLRLIGATSGNMLSSGNTDKIEISFTRASDRVNTAGSYTVYPASRTNGNTPTMYSFPVPSLSQPFSTQRFTWQSQSIIFRSLGGYTNDNVGEWVHWTYGSRTSTLDIPQQPVFIRIRLDGHPHPSTYPVTIEVVLHQFSYVP